MVVEISDWNDLDNVRNDLTGDYVLVNDLDSDTDGYAGVGDDFTPIGVGLSGNFNGTFDGDGFEINDLVVEMDADSIGLFGAVSRDTDQFTIIENLSVSGSVTNTGTENRTGGLAGFLADEGGGEIKNCVSHVDVTALDGENVGGLLGRNDGTVEESYATGSVDGDNQVGGLVGRGRSGGTTQTSYAVGLVTGNSNVGGLVGDNDHTVTDSYATGSVEGGDQVGGLVGQGGSGSSLDNTYSLGDVTGSDNVGGLYGRGATVDVSESYAVGNVTGDTNVGGFAGDSGDGNRERNYFDTESTTQSDAFGTSDGGGGVTALTTAEMQGSEAETNMNFDFADVWSTVEPETIETDTINGQITLDDVAAETATVILHNFSEPESIEVQGDGYPILLSVDEDEQLDSQEFEEQANIARTETDTDGNYSSDIPGATGDTIAIAVDFDDGTERYGRLVTTVIE